MPLSTFNQLSFPTSYSILSAILHLAPDPNNGAEVILHAIRTADSFEKEEEDLLALAKRWDGLITFYRAQGGKTLRRSSTTLSPSEEASLAELKTLLRNRQGWIVVSEKTRLTYDSELRTENWDHAVAFGTSGYSAVHSVVAHILPRAAAVTSGDKSERQSQVSSYHTALGQLVRWLI